MAVIVEASSPDDLEQIRSLMAAAFHAKADAPFLDRRVLDWKYFAAGPPWPGSRSYVLRKERTIYAHCAVWPLSLNIGARQCKAVCFVDWAGGKQMPGAGIILMKKLLSYADVAIVAGGSADTQAVIPKLGFALAGQAEFYARVVRPFGQHRRRPSEGIAKDIARVVRNSFWSLTAQAGMPDGWSAERVACFEPQQVFATGDVAAVPERSAEFLNYWLACPASSVNGFVLERQGQPVGHLLLSNVGGQSRILDLRVEDADWGSAYRVAAAIAAADPNTYEIFAISTRPAVQQALVAAGFHKRGGEPIFFHDPGRLLTNGILWSLADDDTGYVYDAAHPFAT